MKEVISQLKREVQDVLTGNILPYWMERMPDTEGGGFYGRISGEEIRMPEAERGAIMHARILWTFAAAYRLLQNPEYQKMADRAKRELIDCFHDREFGGIYWSIDRNRQPLDTKKQMYAIGFAVYGLSEYHRATKDEEALDYAIRLYHDIEAHSFDAVKNGYFEAATREWQPMEDVRLSAKDANECKTMNTHLHLLEAYTSLYRVWKDEGLKARLHNLIRLFIDRIMDGKTHHLQLFFDEDWQSKQRILSYGHDIEASWLIHEAAQVLADPALLGEVEAHVIGMADAATEGFLASGGMLYELHEDASAVDADRHWWVQAEAIVGYVNLYQCFADGQALMRAVQCWEFVKRYLIDYKHGEWYWSVRADGSVNTDEDKAGFWKCPYHNGRMCMELLERL